MKLDTSYAYRNTRSMPPDVGLYVGRTVMDPEHLRRLCNHCKVYEPLSNNLHVTVLYSTSRPRHAVVPSNALAHAKTVNFEQWKAPNGHILVLRVEHLRLANRTHLLLAAGCNTQYAQPNYHITLCHGTNLAAQTLVDANDKLAKLGGTRVVLSPEYFYALR